jgi:hypothetical protein
MSDECMPGMAIGIIIEAAPGGVAAPTPASLAAATGRRFSRL